MNKLILLMLLAVSAQSFAAHNLQQSACFPNTPEAKDWPVQAIYLSGIYAPGTTFDVVENSNRDYLENYARSNRIRIAVPVAPVFGRQPVHQWNGVKPSSIESQASAACGGAPLAQDRAMIGYSNGGRYVGLFSGDCASNQAYTKFIVIGYPEATRGNCPGNDKRYTAIANHSQFQSMSPAISSQLAALPSNGGGTAVAAVDPKEALNRAGTATGQAATPPRRGQQQAQAQAQPPLPVAPAAKPAPQAKPAPSSAKPAVQAKATPDNCCQGECTSIDLGLSLSK